MKNVKWIFAFILLSLASYRDFANEPEQKPAPEKVSLQWKFPPGSSLTYHTEMSPISKENTIAVQKSFFKGESDLNDETREKLLQVPRATTVSMESKMAYKNAGEISVDIVLKEMEVELGDDENLNRQLLEQKNAMIGQVVMQSDLDMSGTVTTPFLPQKTKNMFHLFFQLPKEEVAIGDTWQLDLEILMFTGDIRIDSGQKVNQVRLSELKEINGEKVAILDYMILESASGVIGAASNDSSETFSMHISFFGTAMFSVTNGRWIKFSGQMHSLSTGIMNSDVFQQFYLEPVDPDPK